MNKLSTKITGKNYRNITEYYIINHYIMNDQSKEYDLYLEILAGYEYGPMRLRDVPTILSSREHSKYWQNITRTGRSIKSSKRIPGYLNAFKYEGNRCWYIII